MVETSTQSRVFKENVIGCTEQDLISTILFPDLFPLLSSSYDLESLAFVFDRKFRAVSPDI